MKGDESGSIGVGSVTRDKRSTFSKLGDNGKTLRACLYRKAMEQIGAFREDGSGEPQRLRDLEAMFRHKCCLKACKGVGQFHLPSMFAYLDRSGRGGFDLEDFRQATDSLMLEFSEAMTIALFAKYVYSKAGS